MNSKRELNWVDGFAHCLIHRAARRAPEPLPERLEEEWLADFAERRGGLSRLRFAVGCCWATGVIAREQGVAALAATSSPLGHGYLVGDGGSPLFSRRAVTFLLVAGLHAAVLYGLAIGLSSRFNKVSTGPLEAREIKSPPHRDLLPLPPPQVSRTRIEVPISEQCPGSSPIRPTRCRERVRSRSGRCPRRSHPWSIACREDREVDFRVPMISIPLWPFIWERRAWRRSGYASMVRDA